ncbi:NADPH:quinone reductase [Tistlia consotensis]|uniref:NADPH:quinone reductase n=1 Tax=Tistlia consotensis USBA 355 TaxID=560819 RepID=A0A1Y6B459_9PROT|nr:zinc-binding dehydrogenase [Tistlia consotensis]SME90930.1 NADPH:quinone reductase [Tistlia consotensis USBA 355]SNR27010.1 NADPH:quinone reductase [Tistlia consotensis]
MKALVLEERGAAGLDLRDFPDPTPAPGEAVMRVAAASINRVDLYMRDDGRGIRHALPMVLGVDGAGEIVEAPAGSGLRPGQPVVLYPAGFCGRCRFCLAGDQPLCEQVAYSGEHRHGTFAEYVAMPAACFLPLPEGVDPLAAATLPVAYLTAWRMLFGKQALGAGETVLIMGVGGGVGAACLQLARLTGARALVTSSSAEKLAKAAELGAEAGIDYRREPVAKRVLELTGGQGVDLVIDNVGEVSWGDSLRAVRRGGRIVTCGATTGDQPPADLRRLFIRQIAIFGSTLGSVEEFRRLLAVVAAGDLAPVIDQVRPLAAFREAFGRVESGSQFGKVVLRVP